MEDGTGFAAGRLNKIGAMSFEHHGMNWVRVRCICLNEWNSGYIRRS